MKIDCIIIEICISYFDSNIRVYSSSMRLIFYFFAHFMLNDVLLCIGPQGRKHWQHLLGKNKSHQLVEKRGCFNSRENEHFKVWKGSNQICMLQVVWAFRILVHQWCLYTTVCVHKKTTELEHYCISPPQLNYFFLVPIHSIGQPKFKAAGYDHVLDCIQIYTFV